MGRSLDDDDPMLSLLLSSGTYVIIEILRETSL